MSEDVKSAGPAGLDTCDCPCHEAGSGLVHLLPCCRDCRGCGRSIRLGASQYHAAICPGMASIHEVETCEIQWVVYDLQNELESLARSSGFDPEGMDYLEVVRVIGRRIDDLKAARSELLAALRDAVTVADQAYDHWNNDRDSKVGKYLVALSGGLGGYKPETDRVHAALARHEEVVSS